MKYVMSIIIWVASFAITAATFVVSWVLSVLLPPSAKREKVIHAQCFWWADALMALNPYWKLKVSGFENIDPLKIYVIVANHESLGDIIVVYKTHMQFKWIAKESLLKVPFIGGLLRVNKHIMLSRGSFGSIKKVYRKAADLLRSGRSVLFFPEGTRGDEDGISEFQNGAFKLAIKEKKPILPIFIGGTRETIPKGDWVFKSKVSGRLAVLPEVDTSGFKIGDYKRLKELVREKLKNVARLTEGE